MFNYADSGRMNEYMTKINSGYDCQSQVRVDWMTNYIFKNDFLVLDLCSDLGNKYATNNFVILFTYRTDPHEEIKSRVNYKTNFWSSIPLYRRYEYEYDGCRF